MNEKLINSFKLDATDYGKFLKLNDQGVLVAVDVRPQTLQVTSHDDHALHFTPDTNAVLLSTEYSIAGFNGPNIVNADITDIIVSYYLYSRGSDSSYYSQFYATYPWSSTPELVAGNLGTYAASSHRHTAMAGTAIIPINAGQTSVTLGLFDGSAGLACYYDILGVIQSG